MNKKTHSVTQFSTMNALLIGLFDGEFPAAEVVNEGNFGLGCSHGIDGEIIVHEGECFIAKAGRPLQKLQDDSLLPFAQVAKFQPDKKLAVAHMDKQVLIEKVLALAGTKNLFIGIKVEGSFQEIKVRRPPAIKKPYPSMMEVLADQEEEYLIRPFGTLVGFWAPEEYQGMTVAGFHVHFINKSCDRGGHVLDFEIIKGDLQIQLYDNFTLRLPSSDDFLQADMNYEDAAAHIKHMEG